MIISFIHIFKITRIYKIEIFTNNFIQYLQVEFVIMHLDTLNQLLRHTFHFELDYLDSIQNFLI